MLAQVAHGQAFYEVSQELCSTKTPDLSFLALTGTLSHIEGNGQPVCLYVPRELLVLALRIKPLTRVSSCLEDGSGSLGDEGRWNLLSSD